MQGRLGDVAFLSGDIDWLPCLNAYRVSGDHDPSGALHRKQSPSAVVAEVKFAIDQNIDSVRLLITSKGPRRAGDPEAKATTRPVTASTNATSDDASCAAKGGVEANPVPQAIKKASVALRTVAVLMANPYD